MCRSREAATARQSGWAGRGAVEGRDAGDTRRCVTERIDTGVLPVCLLNDWSCTTLPCRLAARALGKVEGQTPGLAWNKQRAVAGAPSKT